MKANVRKASSSSGGGGGAPTFAQVQTALAAASSAIAVNNQKITGLATPTISTDASTKGYADSVVPSYAAVLALFAAGTGALAMNGNNITGIGSSIAFAAATTTPAISQTQATSGIGAAMSLRGQQGFAGSIGGALTLGGGSGGTPGTQLSGDLVLDLGVLVGANSGTLRINGAATTYLSIQETASGIKIDAPSSTLFLHGAGAMTIQAATGVTMQASSSGSVSLQNAGATVLQVNQTGLGLFATTPKTQPARAGQLTDNSGGTGGGNTIAAIGGAIDSTAALRTDTANAIATIAARLNSLEGKISAAGTGIGVTA